jgi:putative acetyltransferase
MALIRSELPEDIGPIHRVTLAAFGGEDEALLVDRLRAEGDAMISLVAIESKDVVGHILFSRLGIETDQDEPRVAALAPLAVQPEYQCRGIGSDLVRAGLAACRDQGIDLAVVLGDPAYYMRFGFSAEAAQGLEAPFSGDAFMALALSDDAPRPITGRIRYADAFGLN